MQRKLAAILAADVVGYSRLLGNDEVSKLAALRQLRSELFAPTIAGHHGTIIKSMGDGWLVEFSSAADAVNCAMRVQDKLLDNATIKLRIGIHIGDIVHEDEDIFGDGVNIAARLQEIAQPGSVAISDAVQGALDGTLRPSFDDQGQQYLKNIAQPVRAWSRGGEIAANPSAYAHQAGFPRLSIAPIETSSDNAEVRDLADALTSDLETFLGASHWMLANISVKPIPNSYVARGILRARGSKIRLDMNLMAPDGERLLSDKYDGDLTDGFDWLDTTSQELATRLYGPILDREISSLRQLPKRTEQPSNGICSVYCGRLRM